MRRGQATSVYTGRSVEIPSPEVSGRALGRLMPPEHGRYKKAGHRSWAAHGARVPGIHRGDSMSAEKRSALMARIRGRNTGPERIIGHRLRQLRIHFTTHPANLPGRPDIVFRRLKLAVFIDGDFWHGWRFPLWQHKLSEKWRDKISANRARDARNFRKLRRLGWMVIRIWEHEVESRPARSIERILLARRTRLGRAGVCGEVPNHCEQGERPHLS